MELLFSDPVEDKHGDIDGLRMIRAMLAKWRLYHCHFVVVLSCPVLFSNNHSPLYLSTICITFWIFQDRSSDTIWNTSFQRVSPREIWTCLLLNKRYVHYTGNTNCRHDLKIVDKLFLFICCFHECSRTFSINWESSMKPTHFTQKLQSEVWHTVEKQIVSAILTKSFNPPFVNSKHSLHLLYLERGVQLSFLEMYSNLL